MFYMIVFGIVIINLDIFLVGMRGLFITCLRLNFVWLFVDIAYATPLFSAFSIQE